MHPVKEKHNELESKIGHEQYCWEYFVMKSAKQRLMEEIVVEAVKQPQEMSGKGQNS
jgi:hypothetical protein